MWLVVVLGCSEKAARMPGEIQDGVSHGLLFRVYTVQLMVTLSSDTRCHAESVSISFPEVGKALSRRRGWRWGSRFRPEVDCSRAAVLGNTSLFPVYDVNPSIGATTFAYGAHIR